MLKIHLDASKIAKDLFVIKLSIGFSY